MEIDMIVIIEKNNSVMLQTEYHILNQEQMKNFLSVKNCDKVSYKDFSKESFSKDLELALNSDDDDDDDEEKEYQVMHIWLH